MTNDLTKLSPAELELHKAMMSIPPLIPVVEEFRAYYDTQGRVYAYHCTEFPKDDDNWVHISKEQFKEYHWANLRIIDGKLVKVDSTFKRHFPLTRSEKGVKVVKYHAGLIIDPAEEYSDVEYYDQRVN
jgi:hypothetical protein